MRYLLCGVAAVAMLSACGKSSTEPADQPLDEITLRDGDPAEADAVIAAMSLTNSGDGLVEYGEKSMDGAKATFSDVTIASDDGGSVKAGTLVFEGLDMVEDKASFSKLSLNDISIEDEELEDGSVKVASIEVLNPTPELAAWLASSLGQADPAPFPSPEQIGFAAWSINDVTANFSDSDGDGTFSLANFEVRDLTDQKAKRAMLSGLKFDFVEAQDDIPVKVNLDSLSVSGLDLSILEAVQQNMDDEEAMGQAIINKIYDEPMDPGYDSISMDTFSVDAAGASFKMPSFDATITRNDDGQPVKYVTKPFTMTLDADPDGGEAGAGLAQALSMVNYEKVEMKGAGSAEYDPEEDIVSMDAKDNYFELVDGAKFSFGTKLKGYSAYSKQAAEAFDIEAMEAGEEPDPMAFQNALGELTLYDFELAIEDDSLMNRIFSAAAAQSGQDPEQMRNQMAQMAQMAPMMAQGSGVDMELVSELSSAVSAFITDPGTLTIKLAPEEPISVATLESMEDPSMLTKEYLGFSASHKK
ncbi:hypothetical protein [Henriciella aquimarina]|uniref:hypothetical protein n=1 Tax=Henriciella aquimarina TaxID=545261 RepID=UPI00117A8D9E|nr:hypothetical protein [Henriciella aquimarina]